MKTEIYNLIILDESGSMGGVTAQTISGCNETINTIRSAQQQYADTQTHYVSIYVFQNGGDVPSRYLIKNRPIDEVSHITAEQYRPWGNTPLYDAVGSTLTDLKNLTDQKEEAIGNVTIITDGMENSSTHYARWQVANKISALKEIGWNFSFIGANIDVNVAATSLNIENMLSFKQDDEGMKAMFDKERRSRYRYYAQMVHPDRNPNMSEEERTEILRKAAKGYFDEI